MASEGLLRDLSSESALFARVRSFIVFQRLALNQLRKNFYGTGRRGVRAKSETWTCTRVATASVGNRFVSALCTRQLWNCTVHKLTSHFLLLETSGNKQRYTNRQLQRDAASASWRFYFRAAVSQCKVCSNATVMHSSWNELPRTNCDRLRRAGGRVCLQVGPTTTCTSRKVCSCCAFTNTPERKQAIM